MSRRASQFDQGGGKWRAEWSEVEEACGNGWRRPGWRVIRSRVTDSLDGLPAHTYNTHNNGVWSSVPLHRASCPNCITLEVRPTKGGRASPARTCV